MLHSLPPSYLARLASPVGIGDLVPADAAGEVGSVVGGSGVRVTLRYAKALEAPRRIASARFRGFGSAAARVPGSVLTERLVGLDTEEARRISSEELLPGFVEAVPPAVRRAATHLVEALAKAVDDGAAAARVSAPGVLVCRCMGVGDREIRRAVRTGSTDVPMIGLTCAAGTACHSCWPDLRTILDEERGSNGKAPHALPSDPLSIAVDAVVRPLWRAQGLTLGPIAVTNTVVTVSIAATERDALASPIGAVALAAHALRETLWEGVRVDLSPGAPGAPHGSAPDTR